MIRGLINVRDEIEDMCLMDEIAHNRDTYIESARCGFEIESNVDFDSTDDIYEELSYFYDEDDRTYYYDDTSYDEYETESLVIRYCNTEINGNCNKSLVYEYDSDNPFLYCYHDGSVDVELVTAMLRRADIVSGTARGISLLDDYRCVIDPEHQCGLHETINVVGSPLTRSYIFASVMGFAKEYLPVMNLMATETIDTDGRGLSYRDYPMPDSYYGMTSIPDVKYIALHYKKAVGCIEFRYPDGTDSTKLIDLTANLNMAVIHHAYSRLADGWVHDPFKDYPDSEQLYSAICKGYDDIQKRGDMHKLVVDMVDQMDDSLKLFGINPDILFDRLGMSHEEYWDYNRTG